MYNILVVEPVSVLDLNTSIYFSILSAVITTKPSEFEFARVMRILYIAARSYSRKPYS